MDEIILNRLLRHFRVDVESYNELQRQQAAYIYNCLGGELVEVLEALNGLQAELRTRRLNNIYHHLKLQNMVNSGRYDLSAKKVPMNLELYDRGWKL